MAEQKTLSPFHTLTKKVILYSAMGKYNLTKDDGQYVAFDNGKRFYKLNFDDKNVFLGIREDGNTRTVFNGIIRNFEDFKKVDDLTMC